jgi:quercetin dioxygenase-like cupin family protein
MTLSRHVIENPISGERIVIRETAAQTGGRLLAWELFLAPGGRVPSSHSHPEQEEVFTVLEGRMRFRVGLRSVTAGPGDTVRVPPGTVHHFTNAGPVEAHVAVQTRPALDMEALLETAAALAREQHAAARALPRPVDLALFMRDFEREVHAPYLPATLVRMVIRPLAWLATRRRHDARYRRLRSGVALPLRQDRRPAPGRQWT